MTEEAKPVSSAIAGLLLQVFLDGVALKTDKGADRVTSRIPNTPMRCVLQTETELNSTYPAKSAVANVQLDYIRVWKYVP
jgi:hypothetical protein